MRHLLTRMLVPTVAVVLGAGAAEQPPMMEILVSDGPRLMQRWDASLYAKLWNDRVMEAVRAKFAQQLGNVEGASGLTLPEVLKALSSAQMRLIGMAPPAGNPTGKPEPLMAMQADLGPLAERAMALILERDAANSEAFTLAGADAALRPKAREGKPGQDLVLARYGTRLVASNVQPHPAVWPVTTSEADVQLTIDYFAFVQLAAEQAKDDPNQQLAFAGFTALKQYLAPVIWDATLVPEGIRERIRQQVVYPGVKPVDRSLFARLPENTLMALAVGLDSQGYWKVLEPVVLDLLAKKQPGLTRENLIDAVEQQLGGAGLKLTFPDLVAGVDGTLLLAVTPGAPFPAITLAVPRSAAVDQLLQLTAKTQQWQLPAEGTSGPVTLPNLPLPLSLIADKNYWVISSDPQLPTTWSAGGKGWSASPAVTLAFDKAGADAALIGASDTAAVLRTAGGFLALVPFPDAKDKQTATVLLARAAAAANTGYLVGHQLGKMWEIEARGLLGFGAIPAIAAGVAVPGLLKARSAAGDASVVASLRSGVFPAQIQFQAGGYIDQNGDNVGEYGFFSELAGGPLTGQPETLKLALLPETWNAQHPLINGWHFACWLPDGKGGAIGSPEGLRAQNAAAAKAQSERFVVYAWSTDDAAKPVYALTQSGTIYSKTGVAVGADGPAWNALFDGTGWDAAPAWEPFRKR